MAIKELRIPKVMKPSLLVYTIKVVHATTLTRPADPTNTDQFTN